MNRQNETIIFYYNSKPITQKDIENALIKAGLVKGDIVMAHFELSKFGKLGDIKDKNLFLEYILNAFINVLGNEGTIIVPTFTYSFCLNQVFDIKRSRSTVGIFTEFLRNYNGAVRSRDPIFSCAGIGGNAEKLLLNVGDVCFGKDSIFERLHRYDCKIMNFGRFFDITYLHYVEKNFNVNYRFDKKFSGTYIDEDDIEHEKEVIYYVRYLIEDGKNVEYNMVPFGDELERRGLLKKVILGNSQILCSKAKDIYKIGLEMLKENEYLFLNKNPDLL